MPEMNNFKSGNNIYEVADSKARGVPLTWAQYQALSYEEQHNGTAYYITDMDAVYPVDHELNANSRNAVANDIVTPHILAMENVLGAKNVLPTGKSGTYSGLTFTVNADGSITISGTATDNVYYIIACPKLYAGDYILTGYPSSAIGMNCSLYYDGVPGSDTGQGQPFTLSQYVDNKNVYIFVLGGTNFTTPITFYPMIRPAGTDPTYVPYSMTNKQLTDKVSGFTHGDVIDTNQNNYMIANVWFGYVSSTSKIVLSLPITLARNVSISDISISIVSDIAVATPSGAVWCNNCTVEEKYLSVGGLTVGITCDANPALISTTPIVAGIHRCVITIS